MAQQLAAGETLIAIPIVKAPKNYPLILRGNP